MAVGNEGVPGWAGKVPFEDLKRAMREHRCYFYVGTHPARIPMPYTAKATLNINGKK